MASPFSALPAPDMSAFIQGAHARSNAMMQGSLRDLAQLGQPGYLAAPAPQEEARRAMPERANSWNEMETWGTPGHPQGQNNPPPPINPHQDSYAAKGFGANVPRSLIGTESGGNWQAQNDVQGSGGKGHFGILQFGHGRLEDGFRAGAIPRMTPEQFKNDEAAQVAMSNWHFNDIDNRIRKNGYDRFIGQDVGGAPMTWDGMRAMAHLGGFGGMSRYLRTSGSYNPADAFGTSLRDYAITHSKGQSR